MFRSERQNIGFSAMNLPTFIKFGDQVRRRRIVEAGWADE